MSQTPFAPAVRDISQAQAAVAGALLVMQFDLADLRGLFDLDVARFRLQIRPEPGHPVVLYEWRSEGSEAFPSGEIAYQSAATKLRVAASSAQTRQHFAPILQTEYPSPWRLELGLYAPDRPDDFVCIGLGDFPVAPGVVA